MLKRIEIGDVGPMTDVAIEFDRRLNVLTGDNGLGKSLILDIAFWAECGLWPRLRATPDVKQRRSARIDWILCDAEGAEAKRQASYDSQAERWRRRSAGGGGGERYPVVVYAMVDGGFAVFDQARNGKPVAEDDADQRTPKASRGHGYYVFGARDVYEGLAGADGISASNGLIRDWPDWQYRHKTRFAALRQIIATLSDGIGEKIEVARPRKVESFDSREIPWLKLPYGEIPITHASAAMRRILGLAYMLVWAWFEHEAACRLTGRKPASQMLILFDEVECHLHPQWQRAILPALLAAASGLARRVETQILATTHSPLVLASIEPIFDEKRDQLHLIALDARKRVAVRPLPFVRMGRADIWLMSESFGLGQPMSAPAERAVMQARRLLRSPKRPSAARIKSALRHMHGTVSDTDPLLARLADMAERPNGAPARRK